MNVATSASDNSVSWSLLAFQYSSSSDSVSEPSFRHIWGCGGLDFVSQAWSWFCKPFMHCLCRVLISDIWAMPNEHSWGHSAFPTSSFGEFRSWFVSSKKTLSRFWHSSQGGSKPEIRPWWHFRFLLTTNITLFVPLFQVKVDQWTIYS